MPAANAQACSAGAREGVERQVFVRPAPAREVRPKPPLCDRRSPIHCPQFSLETRRFLAVWVVQAGEALRETEQLHAGGTGFRLCFPYQYADKLTVALRGDRQFVFEIPGGEAAARRIELEFDFSSFERLPVRQSED